MFKQLSIVSVQIGIILLIANTNVHAADEFKLPAEMPLESPRDVNLIQIEPTVINEKYYTSGAAERHQKTSPTLPAGAEIPDTDDVPSLKGVKSEIKGVGHSAKKEDAASSKTVAKPSN